MQSDEELMLAYAAGEEAAFEALFERYAGLVFGFLRRGGRPEEDARELTQQTFLHLHRSRRDFRRGEPLRPWLMTIARNVLRDHLRRERRRVGAVPLDRALETRPARDPGTARVALEEALAVAIRALPPSLRVVIEDHWTSHLSYEEIATRRGLSRSAVKVRAHRAYRALRKTLVAAGYDGLRELRDRDVTGGPGERSTGTEERNHE